MEYVHSSNTTESRRIPITSRREILLEESDTTTNTATTTTTRSCTDATMSGNHLHQQQEQQQQTHGSIQATKWNTSTPIQNSDNTDTDDRCSYCYLENHERMKHYGERLSIREWEREEMKSTASNHGNNFSSNYDDDDNKSSIRNGTDHNINNNDNSDDDNTYRRRNGWQGNDLIHSAHTSNVHLIDTYYVQYANNNNNNNNNSDTNSSAIDTTGSPLLGSSSSIGTRVTGMVHFTKHAESHRGYCHGGAACSVMDDIIGWTAFCSCSSVSSSASASSTAVSSLFDSGNGSGYCCCIPWSGYTVQINTSLCQPIPIDSYLYVQGVITNIIRRKVYVTATIYQYRNNNNMVVDTRTTTAENNRMVYATCEGIVVMNPGMLPVEE